MKNSSQAKKVKFAQGVYAGLTQKEAAVKAGYSAGPGLEAAASKLMKDPVVQGELEKLRAAGAKRAELTREEAIRILEEQARIDPQDFISILEVDQELEDGRKRRLLLPHLDLEKARKAGKLHLLAGFETTDKGGVKIKWHDSMAAIDRLAKLQGWNAPEKKQVTVASDLSSMTEAELEAELEALRGDNSADKTQDASGAAGAGAAAAAGAETAQAGSAAGGAGGADGGAKAVGGVAGAGEDRGRRKPKRQDLGGGD